MRTIRIVAGSRLHFGMLAPAAGCARRFGGAGVMVAAPALQLLLAPADLFASTGPAADRVDVYARRWAAARGLPELPSCQIQVEQLPPLHTGLGVGTQLGLSVARALNEFVGVGEVSPQELADSVGRGQRSAIGTYGFCSGGLLAESGKAASDRLAPLEARVELPETWQWLLVRPHGEAGLHGAPERQAFSSLGHLDTIHAERLAAEMRSGLIPAAQRSDFTAFSHSLYQFGYQSGLSFRSIQGGAYNGSQLEHIVATIRSLGVIGVGQSSWGPTIFALCRDQDEAGRMVSRLREALPDTDITVTRTCNQGAWVE